MRNLTEEILALPTSNLDRMISRAQVLHIVKDAVVVEVDRTMYLENPDLSVTDNRILAIISTVYNLMADFAAEAAAAKVRVQMAELGIIRQDLTDAMMFAANKESGEGATSYHDLAPHSAEAILQLGEVLDDLLALAARQAELGLALSRAAAGDGPADFTGLAGLLGIDLNPGDDE